jgi:hypothetical protein
MFPNLICNRIADVPSMKLLFIFHENFRTSNEKKEVGSGFSLGIPDITEKAG